jgi:hypothetical protein
MPGPTGPCTSLLDLWRRSLATRWRLVTGERPGDPTLAEARAGAFHLSANSKPSLSFPQRGLDIMPAGGGSSPGEVHMGQHGLGSAERRTPLRPIGLVVAIAAAGLLVAACGSGSSSSGTAASGFTAFRDCLKKHGVSLPTSRPTGAPSSGFGGSGASGSADSSAFQACASLRPPGGFGGRGIATAFKAFRSCMSKHGEPIPTTRPTAPPAAGSSSAGRFLNGLNPEDAKVKAALKACRSKLPSFASG